MLLFACLYVPDFPVQAVVRVDEELCQQAVAILEGTPPLLTVIAINPKARKKGIHLGMTKVQAELFDVKLRQRSLNQEASAHHALLDCAYAFSPRVEDTKDRDRNQRALPSTPPLEANGDTAILDITGLDHLYDSIQEIGESLKQLASQVGLEVNVGIAGNLEAATLAARGFPKVTIIPAGSEAQYLGPLPINILDLSTEQQETFRAWGIHTLEALAALPEIGLIERLGQAGKRLQTRARGNEKRPLVPAEPELKFEESIELEDPINLLEPLTFILGRLLNPLCNRLAARNLAASKIRLVLALETAPAEIQLNEDRSLQPKAEKQAPYFHQVTLPLPVPMRDNRTLLKLLHLNLESHPPSASIKSVWLAADAAHPRTTQSKLFSPQGPEPERMEITLAKISVLVGENRAGSPVLCNTHRPDAFQMKKFLPPEDLDGVKKSPRPFSSQRGRQSPISDPSKPEINVNRKAALTLSAPKGLPSSLRRFRPVIAARVAVTNAMPESVTFLNQKRKVLNLAGPWRSNGDWWSESPWARDEWDVTLTLVSNQESAVYRLYQDFQTRQWYVEGVYD